MFLLTLGLLGCSGSNPDNSSPNNEENSSEDIEAPKWFLNPPSDPNYVFAAQSATSQKMQVALDKAMTNARGELATSLETKVEGMTKSFTEEVGDEMRQQFTQTQKTITSKVLRGTSPKERKVMSRDDGTYRAFVLMELPIGKAAKEMMSKLKTNEEMYTRFRASEAFKKMEEAVEEYEKEQKQGMSQQREGGNNQ